MHKEYINIGTAYTGEGSLLWSLPIAVHRIDASANEVPGRYLSCFDIVAPGANLTLHAHTNCSRIRCTKVSRGQANCAVCICIFYTFIQYIHVYCTVLYIHYTCMLYIFIFIYIIIYTYIYILHHTKIF